ncbi:MAG: hypothetical protein ACLFWF_00670 [Alphaproteobacteria bacterium]
MSGSYDLRRSMTATYDREERRPPRRPRVRRSPRGPAHHAFREEVTERPAWVYPVLVGAAVVVASAIVLFMLLGPKDLTGSRPEGTASTQPVDMVIGGQPLRIPANYTQFPEDREGGTLQSVSLYVALPEFTPYTNGKRNVFFSNAPDSPVVFFELRGTAPPLSEAERPDAIYMSHVVEGGGGEGPSGLTRHQFSDDSPFAGEDLFIGKDPNGDAVVFRCSRRSGMVPSPNCWRETVLDNGLAMSYRFKRPYLKYWQAIDRGLRTLVDRFRADAGGGSGG